MLKPAMKISGKLKEYYEKELALNLKRVWSCQIPIAILSIVIIIITAIRMSGYSLAVIICMVSIVNIKHFSFRRKEMDHRRCSEIYPIEKDTEEEKIQFATYFLLRKQYLNLKISQKEIMNMYTILKKIEKGNIDSNDLVKINEYIQQSME